MTRITPIKHRVKSHTRKDKKHIVHKVSSYVRGSGAKASNISRPTLNTHKSPEGYTVKLTYKGGKTETVKVIATDYHRAIDEAFEEKQDTRMPIEISVVDPSLGEIIHWAGSRALKYGKAIISKSYKAMKGAAISAAKDWATKRLIEEAYSESRGTRMMARAKLKAEHPEIYDICDFSKS